MAGRELGLPKQGVEVTKPDIPSMDRVNHGTAGALVDESRALKERLADTPFGIGCDVSRTARPEKGNYCFGISMRQESGGVAIRHVVRGVRGAQGLSVDGYFIANGVLEYREREDIDNLGEVVREEIGRPWADIALLAEQETADPEDPLVALACDVKTFLDAVEHLPQGSGQYRELGIRHATTYPLDAPLPEGKAPGREDRIFPEVGIGLAVNAYLRV